MFALLRPKRSPATVYGLFDIELKAIERLSPSLCRYVFGGEDVRRMTTLAPDQRVKLFFPTPAGAPPSLPHGPHWQKARRGLRPEHTPPMRTYTLRALRREAAEVDVDFVLHGVNGPASAWATDARLGDRLQMVAPNLDYADDPGGYEWKLTEATRRVLLVGDETALPAIAGILEQLADHRPELAVHAYLEVPLADDCLKVRHGPNAQVHWLPRDRSGQAQGQGMLQAVRELASLPATQGSGEAFDDIDLDQQILWEQGGQAASDFQAWIAGEAMAVREIRRYLLQERGLAKTCLTLMGYWRAGQSLE